MLYLNIHITDGTFLYLLYTMVFNVNHFCYVKYSTRIEKTKVQLVPLLSEALLKISLEVESN